MKQETIHDIIREHLLGHCMVFYDGEEKTNSGG